MKIAIVAISVFTCFALGAAEDFTTMSLVDKAVGLKATVITVPPADNNLFGILDIPKRRRKDNILNYWQSSNHEIMINGGYFEADFSPTGLCKINGKIINMKRDKKLSGFVAINNNGAISLLARNDNISGYSTILQAGPYVIDPGGKIGIKSDSGIKAKRTLIGQKTDNSIVIVVTQPITLLKLALSIKRKLPAIERLLNLDGGPSTALKTSIHEELNSLPVRNYLIKLKQNQQ